MPSEPGFKLLDAIRKPNTKLALTLLENSDFTQEYLGYALREAAAALNAPVYKALKCKVADEKIKSDTKSQMKAQRKKARTNGTYYDNRVNYYRNQQVDGSSISDNAPAIHYIQSLRPVL